MNATLFADVAVPRSYYNADSEPIRYRKPRPARNRRHPYQYSTRTTRPLTAEEFNAIAEDTPFRPGYQILKRYLRVSDQLAHSSKFDLRDAFLAMRLINPNQLIALRTLDTFTVDLKRPCGYQLCVPTGPQDICFWAPTLNSLGREHKTGNGCRQYRRFVAGRDAMRTSLVSLVLFPRDGNLVITTGYYGEASRPIPGGQIATPDDSRWWYNSFTNRGHAFVLRDEANSGVLLDERTTVCPW